MKILVSSDIHGDEGLLAQLVEKAKGFDLVLYAGDVSSMPTVEKGDLEKFIRAFEKIGKPCRFIRGNCDGFESDSEFYLKEEEEMGGVRLVPFDYVLPTPAGCTFREVSEEFIAEELLKINGKDAIVVSHQPPFGAGDALPNGMNVGSKAVREWIEREKPAYWLCGHVHEGRGEYIVGETKVINVAQSFVELEV